MLHSVYEITSYQKIGRVLKRSPIPMKKVNNIPIITLYNNIFVNNV